MRTTEDVMSPYDIAFLGHVCFDEVVPFEGTAAVSPGSAVMCGAMAAARTGKKTAAVVKMAPADEGILQPMRDAGVETFLIPAAETTYMRVVHPTPDVDVRRMVQVRNAGRITLDEVPNLDTRHVHLAGVTDQEFSLALIRGLKGRGWSASADMQSFIRQVDPRSREIHFRDVAEKAEIAGLLDSVKLDGVEATILTGLDDPEQAAMQFERWGCGEVVLTDSCGVLARTGGRTYHEAFSNASVVGRTGRGDTAFAAYLAWRIGHDAAESVRFAAALTSLKMETPGPFAGALADVLARMADKHA